MSRTLEIRFPMAVPKALRAFAVVRTEPAAEKAGGSEEEEAKAERDKRARDFACDQVIESWPLLTRLPSPLRGGQERFVFDIQMGGGDSGNAMLFGSSANLACLIHMLRLASPEAWTRRTTNGSGAGPTHIWATGRVSKGELEKVNHLDEKLELIAEDAKTTGGVHWAFFPFGDVKWSDIAKKSGVTIHVPAGRPDPTQHSTPGVHLFLVPAKDGLRDLVTWWLKPPDDVPRKSRWPLRVGAAAVVVVAAALVWYLLIRDRPDPAACHGLVNIEAETEVAKATGKLLTAGYESFDNFGLAREHFTRAIEQARRELEVAATPAQRCLAETHVVDAHYYAAFVDYLFLASCAEPGATCDQQMRAQAKTSADKLLDVDLDRFLHNDATVVTRDHRRVALRDWLEIQIALRFTVTPNAAIIQAIEEFLEAHPCSDAQQSLLIQLALLAEAEGDMDKAREAVARVQGNLERARARDLCPLANALPKARQDWLAEKFTEVNVLEARACYPDVKAAQPTSDLMCAAAEVLTPTGAEAPSGCVRPPTSHARDTVALLRRGIAARTSGERWSLACGMQ